MPATNTNRKPLVETLRGVLRKAAPQLFDDDNRLDYVRLFELLDDREIVRESKKRRTKDANSAEAIFGALLKNKQCKKRFFVELGGAIVFKAKDFRFFLEETKVDNSFTTYKNRIGLTALDKFIEDTPDVVLAWPYKDCVLTGGQSTDEGTDTHYECNKEGKYKPKQSSRKEIFFNQVLAHDEIDRLTDEKALVNWRRHSKGGVKNVDEIKRDDDGAIRENLIIKGNNLLALHCLKKQFSGRVKLIYIDPPYNTGNDSFKYNDNFNHSTWLTFMKNRLDVAKELLRNDGVIFVQCDDSEQAYLKVLMDEVFGQSNFVQSVTIKMSEVSGVKMAHKDKKFIRLKETLILFAKNKVNFRVTNYPITFDTAIRDVSKNYTKIITNISRPYKEWKYKTVPKSKMTDAFILKNKNSLFRTAPNKSLKVEYRESFTKKAKNYYLMGDDVLWLSKRFVENKPFIYVGDIWDDIKTTGIANEGDVKFKNGKKPEMLVRRIIESTTILGDLVLDYHLGSGTTAAVAHKMERQYIGIEQMDYIEDIACARLKKVIGGEQGGISKDVGWQGGGDFIYCELAEWNEKAKQKIAACKNLSALEKLFDEMNDKYFLHYNLRVAEFRDKICQEDGFRSLSLSQHKEIFSAMLDLNQLHIPRSEMADKRFGMSKIDQRFTTAFYGKGG